MLWEIFALISTAFFFWCLYDKWVTRNLPPGPTRLPIIGNMHQLAAKKHLPPSRILQELSKEFGPIMSIKMGFTWQIIIDDFDTMKEVMCSDTFADRQRDEFIMERSFGKQLGILWGTGDIWKDLRRFSLRTLRDFGFGKQKGQEAVMEEELKDLMNHVNVKLKETDGVMNMNQFFTVSVLNILWSMMAGVRFSHDDERLQQLVNQINQVMQLLSGSNNIFMAFPFLRHILPTLTGYGKSRKVLIPKMHQNFADILAERRALGYYKDDQNDFIDVFLKEIDNHQGTPEEKTCFTDQQFTTVAMDLFVAGSETTSNTLEFAIAFVSLHPQVQKNVQAEIDNVVGRNRLPNMGDKPNMPYTEATLLEIQRVANVVPINSRAPSVDTKLGPYWIKKGTPTILNLASVHTSKKLWGDPENFRPERFLAPDGKTIINTDKMLPFGIGKRICLGEVLARATLFTYFTAFLQNYTFSISTSHPTPNLQNPRGGITAAPQPYHALIQQR